MGKAWSGCIGEDKFSCLFSTVIKTKTPRLPYHSSLWRCAWRRLGCHWHPPRSRCNLAISLTLCQYLVAVLESGNGTIVQVRSWVAWITIFLKCLVRAFLQPEWGIVWMSPYAQWRLCLSMWLDHFKLCQTNLISGWDWKGRGKGFLGHVWMHRRAVPFRFEPWCNWQVKNVLPDGLLAEWNRANPENAIKPNAALPCQAIYLTIFGILLVFCCNLSRR